MNLTDEEIRIKVAEAMGYERRPCEWQNFIAWHDPSGKYLPPIEHVKRLDRQALHVPNYPEDLNACAEFETTLSMDFNKPDQWERYMDELHCLVYPTPEEEPEVIARKYVAKCRMISATARQRCLAYLKTKGLIP